MNFLHIEIFWIFLLMFVFVFLLFDSARAQLWKRTRLLSLRQIFELFLAQKCDCKPKYKISKFILNEFWITLGNEISIRSKYSVEYQHDVFAWWIVLFRWFICSAISEFCASFNLLRKKMRQFFIFQFPTSQFAYGIDDRYGDQNTHDRPSFHTGTFIILFTEPSTLGKDRADLQPPTPKGLSCSYQELDLFGRCQVPSFFSQIFGKKCNMERTNKHKSYHSQNVSLKRGVRFLRYITE